MYSCIQDKTCDCKVGKKRFIEIKDNATGKCFKSFFPIAMSDAGIKSALEKRIREHKQVKQEREKKLDLTNFAP